MNGLSIIIPSRTVTNLLPCIEAIRKNEKSSRIIVIDNGLDWASVGGFWNHDLTDVEFLMYGFRGKDQPTEERFIFSVACNQGIREAGDDDVILLNDDALLESPEGFTRMQQAAEENLAVGIIGAVTNLTGQPLQRRENAQHAALCVADAVCKRSGMVVGSIASDGLRPVAHIAFVCVLIPKRTRNLLAEKTAASISALDQLGAVAERPTVANTVFSSGLLDERYDRDYGCEDRDYCEQVRAAGLVIGVHDGCFMDHSKLHSSYRGAPTAPGDFRQNFALLTQKWGPLR